VPGSVPEQVRDVTGKYARTPVYVSFTSGDTAKIVAARDAGTVLATLLPWLFDSFAHADQNTISVEIEGGIRYRIIEEKV
jgi:hypothetical protein